MNLTTHFSGKSRLLAVVVAGMTAIAPGVLAQDRAKIEQQLTEKYPITTPMADNSDIVTYGVVLILQKKGLVIGDATSNVPFTNSYKDGQIRAGAAGTFSKISRFGIPGVPGIPSNPVGNTASRTFVNGEKVYLTAIQMKNNTLTFSVFSDPFNDVRYKGTLSMELPKSAVNSGDIAAIQKTISEVFAIDTSQNNTDAGAATGKPGAAAGTQGAAAPAAPAAPEPPAPAEPVLAPVAPPPPPPDQPPPAPASIEMGQSKDMVTAILGQPQKIAKVAGKEIYFYKDLKVTFKDGKVSDVQ